MSKSITFSLKKKERTERMNKLKAYLARGDEPWPPYAEEFEDNLNMTQTKKNWDSADSAVDIDDAITRLQANFSGALYRDAVYAHAGRNYLLKLGHHNAFRELYEGGKIEIDNRRAWEEDD